MQDVSARRETMLGFQPPAITDEEIAAVAETLRSGWLTSGPRATELERRMADYLEADHVLALASGTAALHLALVALGIGEGDEEADAAAAHLRRRRQLRVAHRDAERSGEREPVEVDAEHCAAEFGVVTAAEPRRKFADADLAVLADEHLRVRRPVLHAKC